MYKNYLQCKLEGNQIIRLINLCTYHGIKFRNITMENEKCMLEVRLQDIWKMKPYLRKTGVRIKIMNRKGPAFIFYKHKERKKILCGIVILFSMLWVVTRFIWQINIIGNEKYTDEYMMHVLRQMDIYPGKQIKTINLDRIEEQIRNEYNDITWISAYIRGTTLNIRLTEGVFSSQLVENENQDPSHIVADQEGIITAVRIRNGTAQVQSGDSVSLGDCLIKGIIYILQDDQTLEKVDYVSADADVFARYKVPYKKYYSRKYQKKSYQSSYMKGFNLRIGNQILAVPFSLNDRVPASEEQWTIEKKLNLTQDVVLPVVFQYIIAKPYELIDCRYQDAELKEISMKDLESYLDKLMKKGVQIIANSVKIKMDANGCYAVGNIVVEGPIGQRVTIRMDEMAKK